jgi:hypothetical protein
VQLFGEDDARGLVVDGLPALEELSVHGNSRTPLGALCRISAARLRVLHLDALRTDVDAARALASTALDDLRDLNIYSRELDAACVSALAAAPWMPRRERLRLCGGKMLTVKDVEPVLANVGGGLRCLETPLDDAEGFGAAFAR